MRGADSGDDRADELTERYRAASGADPARPSDAVRESIFAYARSVAAADTKRGTATALTRRPVANDRRWQVTAAASLIVAGFATLLAWHFRAPTLPPAPEPNPAPSQLAAHNPPATGPTAPAPDAVTSRSKQRAAAPAETPGSAHDATAGPAVEADSLTSSRQALARIAGSTAAENANASSRAKDEARGLENPMAAVQVAPAPAPAPPDAQAPRSQALEAAAAARASVAPNSPLLTAAESGNLERVDQLLRGGISTEQTDARGRTALLIATLRGDTAMVRRLLVAGARPDAVDDGGDTPLAAARRQGPPELARLLERASHP